MLCWERGGADHLEPILLHQFFEFEKGIFILPAAICSDQCSRSVLSGHVLEILCKECGNASGIHRDSEKCKVVFCKFKDRFLLFINRKIMGNRFQVDVAGCFHDDFSGRSCWTEIDKFQFIHFHKAKLLCAYYVFLCAWNRKSR